MTDHSIERDTSSAGAMSMPSSHPRQSRALPWTNLFVTEHTRTPLVAVRISEAPTTIWCKLEFMNPSGSTKDRIAAFILLKAFREGRIGPQSVVVEASSGSTSIAMAMVCAQLGVHFVAVMPDGVSNERSLLIRAFGGEVQLAPAGADMVACMELAGRIARERGAFVPKQFENPDNANAHRYGTAREILEQVPGATVHAIVAGVGTGGTLAGLSRGLRDAGCEPLACAAKPVTRTRSGECGCRVADECFCDAESSSFSSRIPGVVDNMSKLLDPDEIAHFRVLDVDDEHALEVTRRLHALGFPVGPSSGLNMAAAVQIAKEIGADATIVTVFPDRMERYFSTGLLDEQPKQTSDD